MKTIRTIVIILALAVGLLYGTTAGQTPPVPSQEQPQVLTSGPVHEAFAEPVTLQNQAGLTAPEPPPPDIQEVPPIERPRGNQYVWVPGYWAWDSDQNHYVWVSGCWRAAPPNMSWVPGYWNQVDDSWEWVAGCWVAAGASNIDYLPAPPVYEDVEPPGPPPSESDIWVPPCPYWYQGQYVERPGYWLAGRSDWVWVPSHYDWTPRGYIFCPGYWDYPFEDRGVLFAPVYFRPGAYLRAGYIFSPSFVLDLGVVSGYMFTYPRYCHYFFGDYYDDVFLSIGIFPEFYVDRYHTWYDPIFMHERWSHRHEPRWEDNERHDYDSRRLDKELRPPRTYQDMETRQARLPEQQRRNFQMAEPLTKFETSRETPMRFERMSPRSQQNVARQGTAVRSFSSKRNRWESAPAGQGQVQPPPRQGSQIPPPEQPRGNVQRPPEQKGQAPAPEQPRGNVPPAEQRGQVNQPGQNRPPFVPPREVHRTQPERVNVPAPPIVGRRGSGQNSPPPRPTNERGYQGGQKGGGNKRGR